jgi:hypothetical protein
MTPSNPMQARELPGRIHHTLFIYRNRENQLAAKESFSSLLGINDWQEIGEVPEGLSVLISWGSGIELVYPVSDNPVYKQHLNEHGEGFYAIVFGVENLESSVAHIEQVSGKRPFVLKETPKPVFDVFQTAKEAIVGKVAGTLVLLGEFVRK